MINHARLATMLEAREATAERAGQDRLAGRLQFVREFYEDLLGIVMPDEKGFVRRRLIEGRPMSGTVKPAEFSLRGLGLELFGHAKFERYFNPTSGIFNPTLLEAGGIDPTAFIDINLYSVLTGGLVQAKILEQFENPEFIGTRLSENRSTNLNGEKMIGVTRIGKLSRERDPGQQHPRADFGERWVTTQETVEQALAVDVTREAVFFDLSGQVLEVAGNIGEELGYHKETDLLKTILGVNATYSYKGTGYATYSTSLAYPLPINKVTSNPFADWRSLDSNWQLFNNMLDPETNKEILVVPRQLIVMPAYRLRVEQQLRAGGSEARTSITSDAATIVMSGPNPLSGAGLNFEVLSSPIARNIIAAAFTSGNLANADDYWYMGDFAKAFAWMENWPLRVTQASASEYVMRDRGLVASYFADYRGVPAVKDPHFAVQNTH